MNLTRQFEAWFDCLAREVTGIKERQVGQSVNEAEVDIGRNAEPGAAQGPSSRRELWRSHNRMDTRRRHRPSSESSRLGSLSPGQIYQLIQGTAVGTRIAPSYYANLFMDRFKRDFLAQEPILPLVWKSYIDDIGRYTSKSGVRQ